jgi:hypothetical protein
MKKIFISAAVVVASVFGVYTANQNSAMANLSALEMENLELLAEGEPGSTDEGPYYPLGQPVLKSKTTYSYSSSQNDSNSQSKDNKIDVNGKAGYTIGGGPEGSVGGSYSRDKGSSNTSENSSQGSYYLEVDVYVQGCIGSSGTHCEPKYL